MSIAAFIPIKANSERVPGKNFRPLNGKKLYRYLCEHAVAADCFDEIYVDTNSDEIKEYATKMGLGVIDRKPELALSTANGNDVLVHQFELFPNYDYYVQLFVTAPYLQPSTIRRCVEMLTTSETYDSCFTATEHHGFFWLAGTPVLVSEQCPVTTDFVRRSRGGLYYSGYLDFEGAVNYLIAHEKTACAMGRSGRAFVLDHFRWEYVTGKYLAYLDDCLG